MARIIGVSYPQRAARALFCNADLTRLPCSVWRSRLLGWLPLQEVDRDMSGGSAPTSARRASISMSDTPATLRMAHLLLSSA